MNICSGIDLGTGERYTFDHEAPRQAFKNGKKQAIRIPPEFELAGDEAIIHKEGDRLIIEPARKKSLIKLLSTWQPCDEELPDVDKGLIPLDDVELSE